MTLVRRNQDIFPSFSSLFDDFFSSELGDWRRNNFSLTNTTLPKVNIREDDKEFSVDVAAPGMEKKDFNISVEDNLLTISSEKKENKEEKNDKYTKREFCYQSFQRSFTLPDAANSEKIKARYENGILHLEIPKREEARPKPARIINIS